MTLTFFASILLLWCAGSKRLLIVQWTTFFAVLPACIVHAFTLWQFADVLIVFISLAATFAGVSVAMAATESDDRLDGIVAAFGEVDAVWLPLWRSFVLDFVDRFQHSWRENTVIVELFL
jgi:uncharacterized membrane protein